MKWELENLTVGQLWHFHAYGGKTPLEILALNGDRITYLWNYGKTPYEHRFNQLQKDFRYVRGGVLTKDRLSQMIVGRLCRK